MSDEKRNISDINDQKTIDRTNQAALDQTAEQQAFSEEIRLRLAAPDSGKPTLEEFKVMVYKDREKRRKKRNTLVACLVAAFIVGVLSFDALVPEVGADKNPKETIVTEDGVIIEDGGWGSSEEEDNVWVTEEWDNVRDGKVLNSKLLVPKYTPKQYKFTSLKMERIVGSDFICKYVFSNSIDEKIEIDLVIVENGETAIEVNNVSKTLNCSKGKIYIQEHENKATLSIDGGIMVSIWSNLENDEIIRIVEGLSY